MAATCGVGLNNAIATGVNMLGDVHGGAGEQAVALYRDIADRQEAGRDLRQATTEGLAAFRAAHGRFIPGFGHRFHKPVDPRAPRLLELVDQAAAEGAVSGAFAAIGREIDAELGCPAPLARGFFCLSRSVGILAHSWEQMQQGGRNKGPTPPAHRWTYEGPDGKP
jgi:citrate synthase